MLSFYFNYFLKTCLFLIKTYFLSPGSKLSLNFPYFQIQHIKKLIFLSFSILLKNTYNAKTFCRIYKQQNKDYYNTL